jgi:hypothetical protein
MHARPLLLLVLSLTIGCDVAQDPTTGVGAKALAVSSSDVPRSEVPLTPYQLYNPTATSTPTAPPTGILDPMPPWMPPPPPRTKGGSTAPPLPVDEARQARRQRYKEELSARRNEWRAVGLSDEEVVRLQGELKRSILGQ